MYSTRTLVLYMFNSANVVFFYTIDLLYFYCVHE